MRTETVTVRIGEDVGPVDWSHPTAKDMPPIWREAEANPYDFVFSEYRRAILQICMYDGWPYWEPRPAVCFVGPLNRAEWSFFNSYGVGPHSIRRKAPLTNEAASAARAAQVEREDSREETSSKGQEAGR
jgi:hypothetical protein